MSPSDIESSAAATFDRRTLPEPANRIVLYALPIVSGAAALIFEILWLKDLGVLFGNTAQAAATVLSVFFLGLAGGGRYWGNRCDRTSRPLRLYGLLELGIGLSAFLFFGLVDLYRHFYDSIFDALSPQLALVAKMFLASVVLFLPAFFMGGTLPALAEHAVRPPDRLGRLGSLLYALNTFGASAGALLAGFILPARLGFRGAYWVAIAASTAAGLTAVMLDRHPANAAPRVVLVSRSRESTADTGLLGRPFLLLAFLSGFLTLGMEVLWTRLLAQVLNSSTYAFSAILVTFLVALALGSFLARLLLRRGANALSGLYWTLGLSGAGALTSSLVFVRLTHGLTAIVATPDWLSYIRSVFVASAVLMLVPAAFMGMVLPMLFFVVQKQRRGPGNALGRLLAVNSLGSMTGALCAGFILLDAFGYWGSLRLMAAAYLLLSAAMIVRAPAPAFRRTIGIATLAALAAVAMPGARPVVHLDPGERLIGIMEGSGGTVSIVRGDENLVMRLNNSYVLGDTRSIAVEQLQAYLPLLLHPAPDTVFFLGLGTGITAGAALEYPVRRIVAAELLPEVADAARQYYGAFANGLFQDPRVRIVKDDGRSFLAGKRDRYDVIISDLFTPWHAGTGSLYTVEHFRTVRSRLRPGGLFAQWLPLFQMSQDEFLIIARTMHAAFPQITLWRGNFSAEQPIMALIGRLEDRPLDQATLVRNAKRLPSRALDYATPNHMAGLFYAGNLAGLRAKMAGQPLNSDDRPIIEYLSPRLQADGTHRFVGAELANVLQQLLDSVPPERDPVLAGLPDDERKYVRSGFDFFRYHLYSSLGQRDSASFFLERFRSVIRVQAGDSDER